MRNLRERQAQAGCEIGIIGFDRWQDHLDGELTLNNGWEKVLGRTTIPAIEFADEYAKRHGLGLEWGIAIELLNRGYIFEELEVEFVDSGRELWGRCVWYKDHSNYQEPIPEPFNQYPALSIPNLWHATWRTEHAGDQKFSFYSSSMGGPAIVPHKTIIFRKMVFAPPPESAASEAA